MAGYLLYIHAGILIIRMKDFSGRRVELSQIFNNLNGGIDMSTTAIIILVVVLVLLFGGGGGYWWSRRG